MLYFYTMNNYLIKNAAIVNEGKIIHGDVLIKNGRFEKIASQIATKENITEIVAEGKYLLPGLIDDQVHFREPGLTHKANIHKESCAAVAGGVTSFMEMPNVKPPTLTMDLLEEKYAIAAKTSAANYSFYMGVSNDNTEEALKINSRKNDICGLKIFLGASTGNMLVDNIITLEKIFAHAEVLIATHCEHEPTIKNNIALLESKGIDYNHAKFHPIIRDTAACFESSLATIQLAKKHNTRLHILHISTEKETQLFSNMLPLHEKRITAEACVHHLYYTDADYALQGNKIKCNPAIKTLQDREAVWAALLDNRIDIIATDHAPHTWEEKSMPYKEAPAGLPLVQHSLYILWDAYAKGKITLEKIVEKACHAPAVLFQIKERGYIREGYYADAVIVNPNEKYTVSKQNILYKCAWSPLEGTTFPATVESTFINGYRAYQLGKLNEQLNGMRLQFERE